MQQEKKNNGDIALPIPRYPIEPDWIKLGLGSRREAEGRN